MTTSNTDLARECGASGAWTSDFYKHSIVFSMNQLNAFAERIRAHERWLSLREHQPRTPAVFVYQNEDPSCSNCKEGKQ